MGLSAWNAYRARQAALEKTLQTSQTKPEELSTSPALSGVEVEKPEIKEKEVIEEEVKPKPKKKRTK